MIARGLVGLVMAVASARETPPTASGVARSALPRESVPATADGYRVTYTVTVSNDLTGLAPVTAQVVMQVRNGRARLDYLGAGMPGMPAGTYSLYDAATSRMTLVFPARRQFIPMDSAGISSVTSAAMGMMKMTYTDVVGSRDSLGVGETVLGYPTRKFRVSMGFTSAVNIEGVTLTIRTDSETEAHFSTELAQLDPGFRVYAAAIQKRMGVDALFNGDTAMARVAALAVLPDAGLALTYISRTRIASPGSDPRTVESAMRMTAFAKADIEESALVIPSGFTATDVMALTRGAMSAPPDPSDAPNRT